MTARRTSSRKPVAALEARAFYTVAELARVGNVPTYKLRRLLRRLGVPLLHEGGDGRVYYVMLLDIERWIPPLWANLEAARKMQPGGPGTAATTSTRQP